MGVDPMDVALVALTGVTGIIDAVSFLGLGGIFTAFMTGNILFLSFSAAGDAGEAHLAPVAASIALAAFALGVVISRGIWSALSERWRPAFAVSAVMAAAWLVLAAFLATGVPPVAHSPGPAHYPVIAATAVAMGVRSGTIQRLGFGVVTTLATGTLIALLTDVRLGKGHPQSRRFFRVCIVTTVFTGGASGALLLARFGMPLALLIAAAGTVAATVGPMVVPGSRRATP